MCTVHGAHCAVTEVLSCELEACEAVVRASANRRTYY
jgi:hypothetical protein